MRTRTAARPAKSSPWRVSSARWRVGIALVGGLAAAAIALSAGGAELSPMVGWDLTVTIFVAWVWLTIWRMDALQTKSLATLEDPTQASSDALLITAAVASLAAVALVLVLANSAHGVAKAALAGLAIISVALSWALVHTLFTLKYAVLYYRTKPVGGVSFHQDDPPKYSDFAYLSFTVGMTFQVSDTDLRMPKMRAAVLRQSLLSYLFGAVILATTINLVAGLGTSGG